MEFVSTEEFVRQVRTHERLNVVITGKFPTGIRSYLDKYPKALPDTAQVSKAVARLTALLPHGTWVLLKANGDRIMNRRTLITNIRIKEKE